MSETESSRRTGRSVVAILSGLVVVVVLSLGTDGAMRAAGVFPAFRLPMTSSMFTLAAAYRTVYAVAGCYLTARLAPHRPMQHALLGGAIGLALGAIGAVATWNRPELGPHWYPLALVATALPCAWAGGAIRVRQFRAR